MSRRPIPFRHYDQDQVAVLARLKLLAERTRSRTWMRPSSFTPPRASNPVSPVSK